MRGSLWPHRGPGPGFDGRRRRRRRRVGWLGGRRDCTREQGEGDRLLVARGVAWEGYRAARHELLINLLGVVRSKARENSGRT